MYTYQQIKKALEDRNIDYTESYGGFILGNPPIDIRTLKPGDKLVRLRDDYGGIGSIHIVKGITSTAIDTNYTTGLSRVKFIPLIWLEPKKNSKPEWL